MTDQQRKDAALLQAGKILIDAFGSLFGNIMFSLQGSRKSIHAKTHNKLTVEVPNKDEIHAKTHNKLTVEVPNKDEIHEVDVVISDCYDSTKSRIKNF